MPTTLTGSEWFPSNGLNDSDPPHKVPLNQTIDAYDMYVLSDILSKRDGYAAVNSVAVSASPTINSMASLYLSNNTRYELVGTSNGDVWSDSSGTITTKILSGFSTTQPVCFSQFLDTLIAVDGSLTARTWDGTTSGSLTAAPVGKYCEVHLNKLFITGITSARSSVQYSQTGSLGTWTGSNTDTFQVEQNNGQNITGMKSFARNELIIFKNLSMFKLTGYDKPNFNLIKVDNNIGCISNKSIQNFKSSTGGGLLIWAARDGIYVYDGAQPRKISEYIQTFWDTLNLAQAENFCSTIDYKRNLYLLSVTTGSNTSNTRIIAMNLSNKWEDDEGLHFPLWLWRVSAQAMNTEINATTLAQRIVFGQASGIKSYFGTLYSDDGSAIEAYATSPLMTFSDGIGQDNCLRRIYSAFLATAGDVLLQTEIKDGSDWITQDTITSVGGGAAIGVDFVIGVSVIGIPDATFSHRSDIKARSRRIKIRFYQSSASRYFNLQSPVELYTKPGGQRA